MNLKELAGSIARGLVRNGVAQDTAEMIAIRTISDQPDEWNRIVARSNEDALRHVYVFVTKFGEFRFTTFAYAPGGKDNSAAVRELLSTDMGAGSLADDTHPVDEIEAQRNPGAFPVDMYEVADEVNRTVRTISR
jgi:hypothetical protein